LKTGIYCGNTWHVRNLPMRHGFNYRIFMFGLDLDEVDAIHARTRFFSNRGFNWAWLRRADYCPGQPNLKQAVLDRASALASKPVSGKVFMLANLRYLGLYFSPVNFYFIGQPDDPDWLLAEVSNTPWNERHYYLVDIHEPQVTEKRFHVSPFNPIDMHYQWQIKPEAERLTLQLDAWRQDKEFEAGMALRHTPLDSASLLRMLLATPVITVKIVAGIYWEAIKLFIKRAPFYGHPGNRSKHA
jgi:uncharacterized protein